MSLLAQVRWLGSQKDIGSRAPSHGGMEGSPIKDNRQEGEPAKHQMVVMSGYLVHLGDLDHIMPGGKSSHIVSIPAWEVCFSLRLFGGRGERWRHETVLVQRRDPLGTPNRNLEGPSVLCRNFGQRAGPRLDCVVWERESVLPT